MCLFQLSVILREWLCHLDLETLSRGQVDDNVRETKSFCCSGYRYVLLELMEFGQQKSNNAPVRVLKELLRLTA